MFKKNEKTKTEEKIAIIHDFILNISGTERVLKAISDIYPEAPIYCIGADKNFTDIFLPGRKIIPIINLNKNSFWSKIKYKIALLFGPFLIEYIDLRDYNKIISTGACFSKGVITRNNAIHINYCHSPTRQIWDWQFEYLNEKGRMPKPIKIILQHWLRIWDYEASRRPEIIIANSIHTQKRIQKYYKRESKIIYPPVETCHEFKILDIKNRKNYFLIVSRLYNHKNIELAVNVFNKMGWHLLILGDGPIKNKILKMASKNIKIINNATDIAVHRAISECRGFIMPQEEDFGISAVEALSHGTPVLALAKGGALEFIKEDFNGVFFKHPTEELMAWGLRNFNEKIKNGIFDAVSISKDSQKFSERRFQEEITSVI